MKKARNPETVHPPLASYVHQIEISGPQRWLILSGQVGMELDGTLPNDPMEQFENALKNISNNLHSANMQIEDIVKINIYLVGEFDAEQRRKVITGWLNGFEPCMTLVYVAALANPKIRVEIEAMACSDID